MHDCTRRAFMKGGALSLFGIGLAGFPRFLVRAAHAQGGPARPKVLIAIFQRGAVDGLSMIVPHGDPDYYAARGDIAVARPVAGQRDTTLDLDGFFGLHPVAVAPPAALGRAPARGGARLRLARHHALALRRAGLHGVGHAGREEHPRRLARAGLQAMPRGARRPSGPWPWARSFRASCAGRRARWRWAASPTST